MEEKEKQISCEKCQKLSRLWEKPDDLRTAAASLGFRVWFTFASVFVLGLVIGEPNHDSVISILIFLIPMMREYYSFKPRQISRIWLRRVQLGMIWLCVGICGLQVAGVLELNESNLIFSDRLPYISGIHFSFHIIWILLWVLFFLTIADYIAYRPIQK